MVCMYSGPRGVNQVENEVHLVDHHWNISKRCGVSLVTSDNNAFFYPFGILQCKTKTNEHRNCQ